MPRASQVKLAAARGQDQRRRTRAGSGRDWGRDWGIDRAAVFFDAADRRYLLESLGAAAAQESVAVHAYVLMTNHVHLLMTAERDAGVPAVMKYLGQRYVQAVSYDDPTQGGATPLCALLEEIRERGLASGRHARTVAALARTLGCSLLEYAGAAVELSVDAGRLVIAPSPRQRDSLDALLAQCDASAEIGEEDRAWLDDPRNGS